MRVDSQVDPLVDSVSDISKKIAHLLALLPFLEGVEQAHARSQIRELIGDVQTRVREWATTKLPEAAEEHLDDLISILPDLEEVPQDSIDELVRNSVFEISKIANETTASVKAYAATLATSAAATQAVNRALRRKGSLADLNQTERQSIQGKLEQALNERFVRALGKDGKLYHYALDYWVAIQAQMSRSLMLRELSILMTQAAGMDLIQISNNPSTVGDFCDMYRGKVFSLSGTHPFYPPLSSAPNGGTPFHPWCKHTMFPFMSEESLQEFAGIPNEFLTLGETRGASINDFQKLWVSFGAEGEE